jgi:L-ascorbate metabolism protein UlaG (beta-lactamase superfamily)
MEKLKEFVKNNVKWFGQFSLQFSFKNKIYFIDPFSIPKKYKVQADYIFITHSHFDHLSPEDIKKIATKNTYFYAPKDAAEKLIAEGYSKITVLSPNMKIDVDGLAIETLPMYNIKKSQYHPRQNNWIGYLIKFDDIYVYISGDTERIPEMKKIKADIAFLPLGQIYTMNSVEEATEAAVDTKSTLVVPVHYGSFEGNIKDAEFFCQLAKQKDIECYIIPKEQ